MKMIIGNKYKINYIDDESPNKTYIGEAVLVAIDPPEYPAGSYEFILLDETDPVYKRGVFTSDVIEEIPTVIDKWEASTIMLIKNHYHDSLNMSTNVYDNLFLEIEYIRCLVAELYGIDIAYVKNVYIVNFLRNLIDKSFHEEGKIRLMDHMIKYLNPVNTWEIGYMTTSSSFFHNYKPQTDRVYDYVTALIAVYMSYISLTEFRYIKGNLDNADVALFHKKD